MRNANSYFYILFEITYFIIKNTDPNIAVLDKYLN